MSPKLRSSNSELCRIVCMLMIIASHYVFHDGAYFVPDGPNHFLPSMLAMLLHDGHFPRQLTWRLVYTQQWIASSHFLLRTVVVSVGIFWYAPRWICCGKDIWKNPFSGPNV